MSLLLEKAIDYAGKKHSGQTRKYTGEPYFTHVNSVAQLTKLFVPEHLYNYLGTMAYLHDVMEDCEVTFEELHREFGIGIAEAVEFLSDLNPLGFGNRKERKQAYCQKLSQADGGIQTIKVCDMIDNTLSIVLHDPGFAKVYLKEKSEMLDVLTEAHPMAVKIARDYIALSDARFRRTKKELANGE